MFSKLPVEISNLTKLTYLNLSNAMLQDSITTQFTNLTSLRSLDLSCANLVVNLSSISITLTLPPKLDFGSMSSFIRYGRLSSPNLRWLEGLRRLRYLVLTGVDLSKASESFHWDKPISSLSNLMSLQLSYCNISGRIPIGQLLNLTNLSTLDTLGNFLTILGYDYSLQFIGAQLEIVTKGQTHWLESVYSYHTGFDMSSNALTGKIPEKIGILSGLPLLLAR
ncbi:hypothetical protein RND71_028915 [Anisodus tanguticus]|uniref:Uncharacterized protein n=1 Tax=Anisodus tanguticus TaxID=243964 RepID=A0AAE1RLV7_9SOLA|nr:hypothetical protein RND71_028915 [Anisodus tanguticus]